ncbi:hypothetical protein F0562_034501 [Nyssa sinensis]|uniref:CASP-like protein n=1 Tax=Nyssa sinensis TaxID=561372 RepID=A0A5J5AFS4_9ASTE|nr:hypothetical protein F0562_034501 [Nyssa sinensis]
MSRSQPQSQPQPQPQPQPQSESQPQPQPYKTLPITTLVLRVITLISLIVSLIILASDTATIKGEYREVTYRFKDLYAYRYMLSVIVIGLVYTFLQLPFAIHHASLGKRLMSPDGLPHFDFLGDKVVLCLLGTGVGAAFGATMDLKKSLDESDDLLEQYEITLLSQFRSKLDNFFNMAYVSAGFLLIAFFSTIVSSVLSSLALSKKS